MAAFNHMIHRMITLPISTEGLEKETAHIFKIARLNGYPSRTIGNLINKHKRTKQRRTLTSLTTDQQTRRRVAVGFNKVSSLLRPKLKKYGVDLVYTSRADQLKTLLKSTKDPIEEMAKSGIYRITCTDCPKTYIGQTRRRMETRLQEHLREAEVARRKNSTNFRSKVAEHIVLENHNITMENATMVNHIKDWRKLDVAESLEIYKSHKDTLINKDLGNGYSPLFNFIRKYKTPQREDTPTVHTILQQDDTLTSHTINENGNNSTINMITPTIIIPEPRASNPTCATIKRTILDFFPQSCSH